MTSVFRAAACIFHTRDVSFTREKVIVLARLIFYASASNFYSRNLSFTHLVMTFTGEKGLLRL